MEVGGRQAEEGKESLPELESCWPALWVGSLVEGQSCSGPAFCESEHIQEKKKEEKRLI